MRKLFVLILTVSVFCSIATTALAAGNGTINPLGQAKIQTGNGTINPLENGTIQPFESGTILPW